MQIEMRDPKRLIAYKNNARTHSDDQIDELVNSILNFGFNDPVELAEDGTIISGHARTQAAIKAGLTQIPTVVLNELGESQRKAYTLAANRIALNAGWDFGLLKIEFDDMLAGDVDLSLTGFTDEEIEEILNPEILSPNLSEDEGSTDLQSVVITKPGDVWICGNHRVACGDSTNPDHVAMLLKGMVPNLMVTDPPYGVNYEPEWRNDVLGESNRATGIVENDSVIDWSKAYSLFPGKIAYIWHAGKYSHIVGKNIIDCGYEIVSQIIWAKQHFALSRGDYHWQHEPCIYAVKKGENHNWQGARNQSTVWEIENNLSNKEETTGHSTQKPIECMARPIQNNSRPNDYVYDPFCGSGTTLIACEKLNRICLTQEIDPKYVDMTVRRWEKLTGLKAVLESTGELFNG